eukprot:g4510.t1
MEGDEDEKEPKAKTESCEVAVSTEDRIGADEAGGTPTKGESKTLQEEEKPIAVMPQSHFQARAPTSELDKMKGFRLIERVKVSSERGQVRRIFAPANHPPGMLRLIWRNEVSPYISRRMHYEVHVSIPGTPKATVSSGFTKEKDATTPTINSVAANDSEKKAGAKKKKQLLTATVPEGIFAGEVLTFSTPDGALMRVVVPDGLKSGDTFQIRLPDDNPNPSSSSTSPRNKIIQTIADYVDAGRMLTWGGYVGGHIMKSYRGTKAYVAQAAASAATSTYGVAAGAADAVVAGVGNVVQSEYERKSPIILVDRKVPKKNELTFNDEDLLNKEDAKDTSSQVHVLQRRNSSKDHSVTTGNNDRSRENDKLKEAVDLFNENSPEEGIEAATRRFNLFPDSPVGQARFLLDTEGLNKNIIGQLLGRETPESTILLEAFSAAIDWEGVEFLRALRYFLTLFQLPGEAQQIQRIMQSFSKWYWVCNPTVLPHQEAAFVLSFTTVMLNTYTHHPSVRQHTSLHDWKEMIHSQPEGVDIDDELIKKVYKGIIRYEIRQPAIR